jgi:hypothetical protein
MKSNQKSSRNTATLRALPVLNALPLRFAALSKAKPAFPPYARPAPLRQGPRSLFVVIFCPVLAEAFLLTGALISDFSQVFCFFKVFKKAAPFRMFDFGFRSI